MADLRRAHGRLLAALERAAAVAAEPVAFEARADPVSAWSVGQHLEHLLLSDRRILGWVESVAEAGGSVREAEEAGGSVREADEAGAPSCRGWLVLVTGFIPRGKGQAPEATRPSGMAREAVERGLWEMTARAVRLGSSLEAIAVSSARLRHPVLGAFTGAQWLRFAGVHHAHHEKIVRDILRKRG